MWKRIINKSKPSNKTHDYILRVLEQKNTNSTTFLNDTNKCLMNSPLTEKNRKREESNLNFIKKINNIYGGQWFQTYIVEELTNNIYEHAYNENIDIGINYAQVYPQLNMMDLCIYDAGRVFLEVTRNMVHTMKMIVMQSN